MKSIFFITLLLFNSLSPLNAQHECKVVSNDVPNVHVKYTWTKDATYKLDLGLFTPKNYETSFNVKGFSGNLEFTDLKGEVSKLDLVKIDPTKSDFGSTYLVLETGKAERPGTYTGLVILKFEEKAKSKGEAQKCEIRIPVVIKLEEQLTLSPITSPVVVRAFKNFNGLNEFFDPIPSDTFTIDLTKTSMVGVNSAELHFVLYGEKNQHSMNSASIVEKVDLVGDDVRVLLKDYGGISDKYKGTAELYLNGNSRPLIFPLEISVKSNVFWVIFVLILGVVLGRYIKLHTSAEVKKYFELNSRATELRERADGLSIDLLKQIDLVLKKLQATSFDAIAIEKELDEIEYKINTIQTLTREINAANLEVNKKKLRGLMNTLEHGNRVSIDQFNKTSQEFKGLKPVSTDATGTETDNTIGFIDKKDLMAAISMPQEIIQSFNEPKNPRVRNVLGFLTGLRDDRASKSWLLRGLVYMIALIVVLLLGLQTNYVKDPVFGDEAIYDFLNVFLWGSGGEVALKSLFSSQ